METKELTPIDWSNLDLKNKTKDELIKLEIMSHHRYSPHKSHYWLLIVIGSDLLIGVIIYGLANNGTITPTVSFRAGLAILFIGLFFLALLGILEWQENKHLDEMDEIRDEIEDEFYSRPKEQKAQ